MKKRFNLATVIVLMALVAVVTTVVVFSYVINDVNQSLDEYSRLNRELRSFLAVKNNIENRYIGEYDLDKMLQGAKEGMVNSLGDIWSHFWTPDAFALHNRERENNVVSIGVDVRRDAENQGMRVVRINPGSSAGNAGLLVGDMIVEIDGQAVADMALEDFTEALYGEEYTTVTLTVEREADETRREIEILREAVARQVVTTRMFETVGYVRIENFYDRADTESIEGINQLLAAGATSLIFDVRSNPGGAVDVMCNILDRLLDDGGPANGTLITLRSRDGEEVFTSDEAGVDLPMVVLINSDSYSAAEFFAACMQEFGAADLIGERTGGKGYAQQTFPLPDGSGLALSTREYFTPAGRSLAGVGVAPDMEVAQGNGQINSEEPERDPQLHAALRHLGVVS